MEFLLGKTVKNMKENIKMIKSMEREHFLGLVKRSISVPGKTENNMAKVYSQIKKVMKLNNSGKMDVK